MAEAYARFSGRVGICEGPSGGGVTYIIPGVAEADQSSVPLVCITSDIDVRDRDRGTLTEFDQDAIFRPPDHLDQDPGLLHGAAPDRARDVPPGRWADRMDATHLGLPMNVQEGDVPDEDVIYRSGHNPLSLYPDRSGSGGGQDPGSQADPGKEPP